jgi:hypothetical protein
VCVCVFGYAKSTTSRNTAVSLERTIARACSLFRRWSIGGAAAVARVGQHGLLDLANRNRTQLFTDLEALVDVFVLVVVVWVGVEV